MNAREFLLRAKGKTEYETWRAVNRFHGRRFVHFLHIGKTGGSAVKHALEAHRVTQDYAVILHNHEKTLRDAPSGQFVFFFLRDPVARYVSAFLARQREDRPRYYYPWSPEERSAFAEFHTPNELALALSAHGEGTRARAVAAMKAINHVNMHYTKWFRSGQELRSRAPDILFIGFQETLSTDFVRLKAILGLPSDLALPSDPVAANRSPSRDAGALDPTATRNLREWYAQDYELLAVCKSLRAQQDG